LVARGHTERQLAKRLSVSERTVHHHIEHIYIKIGVLHGLPPSSSPCSITCSSIPPSSQLGA
jgi:hypothetical protein